MKKSSLKKFEESIESYPRKKTDAPDLTREEIDHLFKDHSFGRTCEKISAVKLITGVDSIARSNGRSFVRLALVSLDTLGPGKKDFLFNIWNNSKPCASSTPLMCEFLDVSCDQTQSTCNIALQAHLCKTYGSLLNSNFNIDKEACYRSQLHCNEITATRLRHQYIAALKHAINNLNADIVCFNELAFPAINGIPDIKAIKATQDIVNEEKRLVVAGSFHDIRTLFNTGYIFYPGGDNSAVHYHKQISATSVKEFIAAPSQRFSVSINAFGLKICVIICMDMMDYSTIASIVQKGEGVDLLLVPAYTDDMDTMEKTSRMISIALPGSVAVTNKHRSSRHSSSLSSFGRISYGGTPTKHLKNIGSISLYKIDLKDSRDRQYAIQNKYNEKIRWLFGNSRETTSIPRFDQP
jgi:predicted amidohydrolase